MIENTKNVTSHLVLKLLLLGFSLIFVGTILVIIESVFSKGSVNFGGIIVIGPIPIIFGAGENAWLIILVAIVFTIVCLILFFLQERHKKSNP